jgi:hemolysin III
MNRAEGLHPRYGRSEWVADGLIHVVGLVAGLAACVVLAGVALPQADPKLLASLGLYAAGLLTMLGCSALYNLTSDGAWKSRFQRLDHAAIFVMIAGTYTPFVLVAIGGSWGVGLLVFVWLVAAGGVALKLLYPPRFEGISTAVYLLLGWTVVVAIDPLFDAVSRPGIVLLTAGGLLYSLGVVFHLWTRLPYHNAIWHGFVLAAAACHYAAVLGEVALASWDCCQSR